MSDIQALQKENGLLKLALESKCDLLKSCESALNQSHATNVTQAKRIAELEGMIKNSGVK